jgi:hypothetical protein
MTGCEGTVITPSRMRMGSWCGMCRRTATKEGVSTRGVWCGVVGSECLVVAKTQEVSGPPDALGPSHGIAWYDERMERRGSQLGQLDTATDAR